MSLAVSVLEATPLVFKLNLLILVPALIPAAVLGTELDIVLLSIGGNNDAKFVILSSAVESEDD